MHDVCLNQGEYWHSAAAANVAVKIAKDLDGMLWYVPSNLEGLYKDFNKEQKVLAVDDPVGFLPDWTNEFDLSFYTEDSKRPLIKQVGQSGVVKYLEFDSTKALFTEKDFYVDGFLNDFCLCFAGNITPASGVPSIFIGNYDAASYNTFFIGSTAEGNIKIGVANAVFDTAIPWGTDLKVVSVLRVGNTAILRVNQQEVLREELPVTVRPNINVQFRDFLDTLDYPSQAKMLMQFMSFNKTQEQQLNAIETLGTKLINA